MSKAKQNLREKIYKNMERKMEQAMQATPPKELYEYLMDQSIPKTEAEHYAAHRIAELEGNAPYFDPNSAKRLYVTMPPGTVDSDRLRLVCVMCGEDELWFEDKATHAALLDTLAKEKGKYEALREKLRAVRIIANQTDNRARNAQSDIERATCCHIRDRLFEAIGEE